MRRYIKKKGRPESADPLRAFLVEAAGIEPASEGIPHKHLHA